MFEFLKQNFSKNKDILHQDDCFLAVDYHFDAIIGLLKWTRYSF